MLIVIAVNSISNFVIIRVVPVRMSAVQPTVICIYAYVAPQTSQNMDDKN